MGDIASTQCRSFIRRQAFHRVAFLLTVSLIGPGWTALAAPQEVPAQSGVHLENSGEQGGVLTSLAALIEETEMSDPAIRSAETNARAAALAAPQVTSLP